MKILAFLSIFSIFILFFSFTVYSDDPASFPKGGPGYLYVKPTVKPPHHGVYDEELKCIDCHSYDGTDAYTSATMTMKKSKKGRMQKDEIQKAIVETLKGNGNYRDIYVLSTSFENSPLASVIELVLDPETMTFYAMSEKQTEKLFQIAYNKRVSFAYVKQVEDHDYFRQALGVQVVGKADLLTGKDTGFEEAAKIYLPTLPPVSGAQLPPLDILIKEVGTTKILTRIVPERINIMDRRFRDKGYHSLQIWQKDNP